MRRRGRMEVSLTTGIAIAVMLVLFIVAFIATVVGPKVETALATVWGSLLAARVAGTTGHVIKTADSQRGVRR